jgi:hypothetical protein
MPRGSGKNLHFKRNVYDPPKYRFLTKATQHNIPEDSILCMDPCFLDLALVGGERSASQFGPWHPLDRGLGGAQSHSG